jgi:hypothetical protein
MKIYLSGGIEYANNYGKDWRTEISTWIQQELGRSVFNPTKESIDYFHLKFPSFKRDNLKNLPIPEIREIIGSLINFEISTVMNETDFVICLWDESCYKGAGTQGELTVAGYNNIPVYVVTSLNKDVIPSWIIGCSTEIFDNFDTLKSFLITKYHKK